MRDAHPADVVFERPMDPLDFLTRVYTSFVQ
jgi:hypothetical protein